jgi:hypothetical protein
MKCLIIEHPNEAFNAFSNFLESIVMFLKKLEEIKPGFVAFAKRKNIDAVSLTDIIKLMISIITVIRNGVSIEQTMMFLVRIIQILNILYEWSFI